MPWLPTQPITRPDPQELQADGQVSLPTRQRLAIKAFQHTAGYDTAIAALPQPGAYRRQRRGCNRRPGCRFIPSTELRYGENPHQQARLFHLNPQGGAFGGEVLQGKALSYNNLLDLDAAWRAALSFGEQPAIAIVKHLSPCGIASASNLPQAFRLALQSDPVSAYGGVIAASQTFDLETVEAMGSLFVECIIAPGFAPEALEKLAKRKNLRLVSAPDKRLCAQITRCARSPRASSGKHAILATRPTRRIGRWSPIRQPSARRVDHAALCLESLPARQVQCHRAGADLGRMRRQSASAAASPTASTVCALPSSGPASAPKAR